MFFNKESCNLCGVCFNKCPTMGLPIGEAKEEIKALIDGEKTKRVLTECQTCFSCNTFCPRDSNPYGLILSRWHEAYKKNGLPEYIRIILPLEKPNFNTIAQKRLPEDEQRSVQRWEELSRSDMSQKEIFFASCNTRLVPYITYTKFLEGMPIVGSQDMCCGEVYYRMGLFDKVEQNTRKLEKKYRGLKKMTMMCPACYNMFKNVLPQQFDAKFDFEVEHLLEYLSKRIENGEIKIKNKTNRVVTVQDSCHAKVLGPDFMELPRKILGLTGAEIVEMAHCKESALCCGIGASAATYSLPNLLRATLRRWKEARRTGADYLVVYCNTCLMLMSIAKKIVPSRMQIYHVLEILQMSAGEEPLHRHAGRAGQISRGIVREGFPTFFSRKRFWVDNY